MWCRELFENVKWNSGQSNQEWRSDAVSRGHVRSKTKVRRADKWFVGLPERSGEVRSRDQVIGVTG